MSDLQQKPGTTFEVDASRSTKRRHEVQQYGHESFIIAIIAYVTWLGVVPLQDTPVHGATVRHGSLTFQRDKNDVENANANSAAFSSSGTGASLHVTMGRQLVDAVSLHDEKQFDAKLRFAVNLPMPYGMSPTTTKQPVRVSTTCTTLCYDYCDSTAALYRPEADL